MRSAFVCLVLASCSGERAPARPSPPAPLPAPRDAAVVATDIASEAALLADVAWLAAPERGGRGAGSPGDVASREWLGQRFASIGLTPLGDEGWFQPFPVDGTTSANVIGWSPGSSDRWILVGAHLDHLGTDASGQLYPGADDNASGVAAMLGIATAAAADRTRKVGILFVGFGAEERGLLGSRHLATRLPKPASTCLGMINLDMVGRSPFLGATLYALPKALLGIPGGPGLGVLATPRGNTLLAAARTACTDPALPLYAAEDFPRLEDRIRAEGNNRSDDAPFAAAGLTTLFFSTSLQDDYHQPTDTVDKIDGATLRRATSCVWKTIAAASQ